MAPRVLVLLLAILPLALAGCASDDADDGAPPADATPTTTAPTANGTVAPVTLHVATSGTYPVNPGFSPAKLEAPAGATVTVEFVNEDANAVAPHNWVLEGVDGAATDAIGSGETAMATFTAPAPGEYTYFCAVGDHRARGMVGTFVVK